MKRFLFLLAAALVCISFGAPAMAAGLGDINTMRDMVRPNGKDAVVVTEITGTTDSEGRLALPLNGDAQLVETVALQGTLLQGPAETESGATAYYLVNFEEKEQEIALRITATQAGVYALGKAKTKNTSPGNLKALTYRMVNTAPVKIGEYILCLDTPEGYELAAIVGYDPEEDFRIGERDGFKYGYQNFGGVKPGEKAAMTLNLQEKSHILVIFSWIVTVVVSAFFLYKNRGMLQKASELGAQKKADKDRVSAHIQ
jgi:hypothetical protein